MKKIIYFYEPLLTKWLDYQKKKEEILFLDVEPDYVSDNKLRFDLDIAFRPISVMTGTFTKKEFSVGSRSAKIELVTTGNTINQFTPAQTITVDVEHSYTHKRQSSVKLAPKIETPEKSKVELGEISLDNGDERTFKYKLSGTTAQYITPTHLNDTISWIINFSPAETIFRDYLAGNIYLFAETKRTKKMQGKITVSVSDVLFFDENRKVVHSEAKSLYLRCKLWLKGKKFPKQELNIDFWEGDLNG